ncbi:MAG: DarT ssDNA thymidine ADP-ribosyltransferase family protein [archaeon]
MLEEGVMYYVNDRKSRLFGRMVYSSYLKEEKWRADYDYIEPDFDFDKLEIRRELQPMIRKAGWEGIEKILKESLCEGFFHFTDLMHLPRIFREGYIASRALAIKNGLVKVDCISEIGKNNHVVEEEKKVQDYARFTIQAANPIQYNYLGFREGNCVPQPCVICVDPSIAFAWRVMFSKTNANTGGQKYGKSSDFLSDIPIANLQHCSCNSIEDRCAELLYPHGAPINFIKGIYFRTKGEMKHAINLTPGWFWHDLMVEDSRMFGERKDVCFLEDVSLGSKGKEDQSEFSLGSNIRFRFSLNNPDNSYVCAKVLHDGEKAGLLTRNSQSTQTFDLNKIVRKKGDYKIKLFLIKGKYKRRIYTTNFVVE